jgi:hypothetical protein
LSSALEPSGLHAGIRPVHTHQEELAPTHCELGLLLKEASPREAGRHPDDERDARLELHGAVRPTQPDHRGAGRRHSPIRCRLQHTCLAPNFPAATLLRRQSDHQGDGSHRPSVPRQTTVAMSLCGPPDSDARTCEIVAMSISICLGRQCDGVSGHADRKGAHDCRGGCWGNHPMDRRLSQLHDPDPARVRLGCHHLHRMIRGVRSEKPPIGLITCSGNSCQTCSNGEPYRWGRKMRSLL